MTHRSTEKRRLEGAGFRFYSGWLPEKNPQGPKFAEQVAFFADEVAEVSGAERDKGRPRKEETK